MMGSFSLLILLLLRENLDECRLVSLVSFTGFPSSHQESQPEVEAQRWRSIVRSVSILIVMLISSFQWLTAGVGPCNVRADRARRTFIAVDIAIQRPTGSSVSQRY